MNGPPGPDPSWVIGKHAFLALRVIPRNGRSEIEPTLRRIPYQWQGYHYQDHDDQPFLLLHNSAGGFVEDDVAELHVRLEPTTRALFTTTAATKFYKCEGGGVCEDIVDVELGTGALFEYLPDEVIPYARSRVSRQTRFRLEHGASLFASDILSAGRINYGEGEAFAFTSMRSDLELRVDGRLLFGDRLRAVGPDAVAALPSLWAGKRYLVTVLAYGEGLGEGCEATAEEAAASVVGVRVGATRKGALICVRVLADQSWQAHEAVQLIWAVLRPDLAGKPARVIAKS